MLNDLFDTVKARIISGTLAVLSVLCLLMFGFSSSTAQNAQPAKEVAPQPKPTPAKLDDKSEQAKRDELSKRLEIRRNKLTNDREQERKQDQKESRNKDQKR